MKGRIAMSMIDDFWMNFDRPGFFSCYMRETGPQKKSENRAKAWTKDGWYYIEVKVPGWNKNNTTVSINDNKIVISKHIDKEKGVVENTVTVSIDKPVQHGLDKVNAWFKDGVLTLAWPLYKQENYNIVNFKD
jgi:HSP20 family molecular chaperone IbpA